MVVSPYVFLTIKTLAAIRMCSVLGKISSAMQGLDCIKPLSCLKNHVKPECTIPFIIFTKCLWLAKEVGLPAVSQKIVFSHFVVDNVSSSNFLKHYYIYKP